MKNPGFKLLVVLLFSSLIIKAQTINWNSLNKLQRNIANINIAADYGLAYGISYGYQLKSKKPIVLNAEYSFPSGKILFDDFKIKSGGQIRWFQSRNFYFASKLQGIFRRYNNSYARLLNFGADMSTTAGYYKPHWFVAGEFGFDKAIITYFKHSSLYKDNFPDVKDGWYEPSTGGNLYYGAVGGFSRKKFDIYLKAGLLTEQDFKSSPMLPFYTQLGLNVKFNNR